MTILLPLLAYLATLVLIRWVLVTRTRTPSASVAWVLAILLLPILGGVLFMIFGINRVERRQRRRIASHEHTQEVIGNPWTMRRPTEASIPCGPCSRLSELAEKICGFAPTSGNTAEIIADTNRTLGLIRQAILTAKESVHLEYYIWEPDKTGYQLRDLLIEKAREGLAVRFLYDSLGSMTLRNQFFKPMREAGIEVAPFSPGQSLRERYSLNLRSHRKIVVVDGKVGFTGGMNIGDEYLGKIKRIGSWRDTHARFVGPAVLQLQQVFAEDWFYATGTDLTDDKYFPAPAADGNSRVQIISGGPLAEPRPFHAMYCTAIAEAQDEVLLTTSYFIPTEPLAMALETAALRGVKVRILVPGRTAHFMPFTVWAGRSYYESLLSSGCEIYEYMDGMLHSKTIVVDRQWSMVGTPNFDARSVQLNFEVAAAFFDTEHAEVLVEAFERDLKLSDPVTTESRARLKPRQIILENAMRLFAPVM